MRDTGFDREFDKEFEDAVKLVRRGMKKLGNMLEDPISKVEKFLTKDAPEYLDAIRKNGGWAKFFSMMWNVQEMCREVLTMAEVVKWVQGNLPKGAKRAAMLPLPEDLIEEERAKYKAHYSVCYLDSEDEMAGDKVLYCHCNAIDDGLKNAFGNMPMLVFG